MANRNLGDIFNDWQKRNIPPVTREGIVQAIIGDRVRVKMRGSSVIALNNAAVHVMPGDTVMVVRERKFWAIQSVFTRSDRTNPSQATQGGGQVQPIAPQATQAGAVVVSAAGGGFVANPQVIEFMTLRDRAMVGGYVNVVLGGTLPVTTVYIVRGVIDGRIYTTEVGNQMYRTAAGASDAQATLYAWPVVGLSPGAHTFLFEVNVSSLSAGGTVTCYAANLWAMGL